MTQATYQNPRVTVSSRLGWCVYYENMDGTLIMSGPFNTEHDANDWLTDHALDFIPHE